MNISKRGPTPSKLYSFSRLKSFNQCPMQYKFRYLDRLKESFRSIESYLGSTVHDVLEWLYGERDRDSNPSAQQMLDRFACRWSESWNDDIAIIRIDENQETYVRTGREMLARFHRETFTRDRSQTVSLEQRLSAPLADGFTFTGIADRVGRTEKGRLFVIDYKTSRSEGDGSEFSEGLQAPLYAACILQLHGERVALAGYHYLRHGTTRWRRIDDEQSQGLMARVLELVGQTEAADDFPARPGILCAWCGFNDICPAAEVPDRFAGGLRHAEATG